MRRLAISILIACLFGLIVFWWLSAARVPDGQTGLSSRTADVNNGELVYWASGCASCHADKQAKGEEKLLLGGGHRLNTPFGTFVTPNVSPDGAAGIGGWTVDQFAVALRNGVSPQGDHYFPSFPYASYAGMTDQDVVDLFAFMKALPSVSRANEPHELPLPFQWRRPLGIWKILFGQPNAGFSDTSDDQQLVRGRYLVEVLGHCGECHTPRNLLGGMKSGKWLAGGPAPEGVGKIPNITPHESGIGSWSENDIAYYLESGFTPDFDSVGGSMVSVQNNMALLPASDREAIAAYLKAVAAIPSD